MSDDEHVAHILDRDGVTPTAFVRTDERWTNTEEITLVPGAVLDLGNGMTVANDQTLGFTYMLHEHPED